ncbi:MAG: S53 family peptidase [Candidatus Obscuribacterales bacterium]|nr:S53 family peptidase [Candidatus Obscuribacterales bacterium]
MEIKDSEVLDYAKAKGIADTRTLLSQEAAELGMNGSLGKVGRLAITTAEGIKQTPNGICNAIQHNIEHPIEALKVVGGSAAIAAGLKVILPEAGPVGRVAGIAMGVWFIAGAAPAFGDAYRHGLKARNWHEMKQSGIEWGNAAGHLGVNSALGLVGYKIGAGLSGKILARESMDGFADLKQNFWDSATDKAKSLLFLENPVPTATSVGLRANYSAGAEQAKLLDSVQENAPSKIEVGPSNPEADMSATVFLKSRASALKMDRYITRMAEGKAQALSDLNNAFQEKFGAKPESLEALTKFAEDHKLSVVESDLRSGRVLLSGKTGDFQTAFDVTLKDYATSAGIRQGHVGGLSMPAELAPHVRAVFGVDMRPAATPNFKLSQIQPEAAKTGETTAILTGESGTGAIHNPESFTKAGGYLATEIAKAQNMPLKTGGEGQHGAFISLGGGVDLKDYNIFFKDHGLEQPKPLRIVEVNGAKNSPGDPLLGDTENALDALQMQSMAPKAHIDMILGPNSDKGLIDVFERGIFPKAGEAQKSVISASWGLAEQKQTPQAIKTLSITFRQAAIRGVQIFAGSGDSGARSHSPTYQPEYPASDPNVVGVGGLKMILDGEGKLSHASGWNEGELSSSGGGVSKIFRLPRWQREVNVPMNLDTGKAGRGVPDISTNAAKATGFPVRVGGSEIVIGGTSAGAPLYAGMMLNINAELALLGIKPVTPLNPWLYARAQSGIFNDVSSGSNFGYEARQGWDAVTGLGWVDGNKMLQAMKANQTVYPNGYSSFLAPVLSFTNQSQIGDRAVNQ